MKLLITLQKVSFMEKTIDIISRPLYMGRIEPYIGRQLIKVLTGQRRVGKSYILRDVARRIVGENPEVNIVEINLEDFAFSHITTAEALHDEIMRRRIEGKRNAIFIDEIQEIDGFDRVLRSLNLDWNNDIYVTGSNSKMLSSEIGSRLAGRHVEIRVHPLSYMEFLLFHRLEDDESALDVYLRYGGLPYLINLPNQATWQEYIAGVTDAITYRDIVTRHNIRNNDFLQRLMQFLADNIGQIVTAKRISDFLKSQRMNVSVGGVQTYIDHITQSYMIGKVRRWNVEGKRFFEIGEKYFFEDLGMRNSITGYRPNDVESVLENAVYNHLIICGYDVKVGKIGGSREIDFIAEKNGEKRYVQVALNVSDETTFEREFGNLAAIPDNYLKQVVTLRDSSPNTLRGISLLSLRQFLQTP